MLKDIAKLEDRLEIYSYGLYEPHFSFESSEDYKAEIHRCYEAQKEMIRNDVATVCGTDWTFNNSESQGRKAIKNYSKIMLRAFNGSVTRRWQKYDGIMPTLWRIGSYVRLSR